jgi:mRNA-degrading endonuclease RelE of RelBE toxin-antitoxin system
LTRLSANGFCPRLMGLGAQPPTGDIKRLVGDPPQWRLRVGDWRVRFDRDPEVRVVVIQRVLPYRD